MNAPVFWGGQRRGKQRAITRDLAKETFVYSRDLRGDYREGFSFPTCLDVSKEKIEVVLFFNSGNLKRMFN